MPFCVGVGRNRFYFEFFRICGRDFACHDPSTYSKLGGKGGERGKGGGEGGEKGGEWGGNGGEKGVGEGGGAFFEMFLLSQKLFFLFE